MAKLMRDMWARMVPVWVIAGVAARPWSAFISCCASSSAPTATALAARLIALNPGEAVTIERAAFVPFTRTGPHQHNATPAHPHGARAEIEAGGLDVVSVGDNIVVQVNNLMLFASGKRRCARRIRAGRPAHRRRRSTRSPGPINVIGHTDNVKPKASGAFKSNFDLSVARAKAVEKIIGPKLTDPARVSVEGRARTSRSADNKTPEGRAKNRRVEVMIPRAEE